MDYKYLFFNDYSEGANPEVLDFLQKSNLDQESGYGLDSVSNNAIELIRDEIANKDADVHFVSGGTQANLVVLGSLLRPHESVICAQTGHINVHEAGAIEATGHKINVVETEDGKLVINQIQEVLDAHTDEHMVKPRVVFISQSTEVGTVYTRLELEEMADFCKEKGLYLYLDGARIGSALASKESGMTLADVAEFTDIFYIGGTKNGAMLGEAVVITDPDLKKDFRFHLKQRGALLAKGKLIGAQFAVLFGEKLYFKNAEHANSMAARLVAGIKEAGYGFLSESTTNQIFPILPNKIIEKLSTQYGFYVWRKVDGDNSAIRMVTSWATSKEAVDGFIEDLKTFKR